VTRRLTATEVKARILALLDDVAAGETIEITKHGRPVARLVPATGAGALRGIATGLASTAVDDEAIFTTATEWEAG